LVNFADFAMMEAGWPGSFFYSVGRGELWQNPAVVSLWDKLNNLPYPISHVQTFQILPFLVKQIGKSARRKKKAYQGRKMATKIIFMTLQKI
jgi:hypothetical protein